MKLSQPLKSASNEGSAATLGGGAPKIEGTSLGVPTIRFSSSIWGSTLGSPILGNYLALKKVETLAAGSIVAFVYFGELLYA